ncbi:MAG: hypothetical protein JST41_14355 [Bacteroidetes bacterium]|nr:hypothetical protein [Bacteroidota bacterium]
MKPTPEERVAFHVDYPQDTEFSAYARLLQSRWRESQGYPMRKLGSFLDASFAKSSGANFLTQRIRTLAENEMATAKASKALFDEGRMWENLLSSQPLCFNLFGELHYDMEAATPCFKRLFPDRIGRVTAIKFEYSPGRGDAQYTGDKSAFDVFVEYERDGRSGFIGIEVKYAESLREEQPKRSAEIFAKHKARYEHLTEAYGVFAPNVVDVLRRPPMSQIWRDHLLSIALLHHADRKYDEGCFVFLFPSLNKQCQEGVNEYAKYLASHDENVSGFCPRHLEQFIHTVADHYNTDWSNELRSRYLG